MSLPFASPVCNGSNIGLRLACFGQQVELVMDWSCFGRHEQYIRDHTA